MFALRLLPKSAPTIRTLRHFTTTKFIAADIPEPQNIMANPRSTAELKKKYGEKSRARDFAIRLDHHSLKNDFPEHSFAPGQDTTDKDGKLKDYVNRKRLIYRSKQRGWLEVDLLLGSFATQFIPTMSQEELDDYELILNQETLDIFNFIIERDPLPVELKTPVMQQLQDFAATNPIGTTDDGIEGYAQAKKNMSN